MTLFLSTRADRFGRRRTLFIGSVLKILAGVAFSFGTSYPVLLVAGIVGVISTSGGECGPFLAVEQAALTDAVLACRSGAGLSAAAAAAGASGLNTDAAAVAVLFGYYNMVGYWAQAAGALASGYAVDLLQAPPLALSRLAAFRDVFLAYAATGATMALAYACLSAAAEARDASAARKGLFGLRRPESVRIVARLSAFFALDAFAGAFTMQSFLAFWFSERWALPPQRIGALLSVANVVAGASGVAASHFVKRLGAMLTMIVTHLPSNVLLLAVPLMPTPGAAAGMLVARFCISQMDVPARQAYVAMVVASDERSAAGGITNIVRSLGMSAAPLLLGYLSAAQPRTSLRFASPFFISGGLKIVYDVGLYTMYTCSRMRSDEVGAPPPAVAAAEAEADLRAPLLGDEDEDAAAASEAVDAEAGDARA